MKVLGLDSATWTASVGVVDGEQILAEQSAPASTSHAVSLLGLIESTLAAARLAATDLDLLAVSIGPGSFTGLRIGLSVVKGLALATGLPVVAVPTLEAFAFAAGDRPGPVCVALDARKGELYMAVFQRSGREMNTIVEPAVVPLDEFLRRLPSPCTIVGDGVQVYENRLRPRMDPCIEVVPFAVVSPRGAVIAALGQRRFRAVGAARLDMLEPTYVRPSEAELKRREVAPPSAACAGEADSPIVESAPHEQN